MGSALTVVRRDVTPTQPGRAGFDRPGRMQPRVLRSRWRRAARAGLAVVLVAACGRAVAAPPAGRPHLVEVGHDPHPEDIAFPLAAAPLEVDRYVGRSLPDGGVLLLGEHHHMPAVQEWVARVILGSRHVDCVFAELPITLQPALDAYAEGAIYEASLRPAVDELFLDEPDYVDPTCDPRPLLPHELGREILLSTARRRGLPVLAIDAPREETGEAWWRQGPEVQVDFIASRSVYMALAIADAMADGRCRTGLFLTGRAHVTPRWRPAAEHAPVVQDLLDRLGVDWLAWPVVDVAGEVEGRLAHARSFRLVRRDGEVVAVWVRP